MLTGFPHVLKRYGLHADVRVVMDLYRVMEMGLINSLGSLFETANHAVTMLRTPWHSGTIFLELTPPITAQSMLRSGILRHLNIGSVKSLKQVKYVVNWIIKN